jgi:hypothetical protein
VHAELLEDGGGVKLKNKSPNGTIVNDEVVLGVESIQPGAVVSIGPRHPFTVSWKSFRNYTPEDEQEDKQEKTESQGPLSSPIVRAVIAIYLVGILAFAVWLSISDSDDSVANDDWPTLSAAYANYRADNLGDDAREERAARAEDLVRELRVMKTQGLVVDAERICREMMSIDKDPKSPLYQYGVRCLSSM